MKYDTKVKNKTIIATDYKVYKIKIYFKRVEIW